jgi:TonB family protein
MNRMCAALHLVFFFSFACCLSAAAQPTPAPMRIVESMPRFKGDLAEFLSKNLSYPEAARVKGIEGRSIVEFVVEPSGLVDGIKIVRTSGSGTLDSEALRVMQMMRLFPYWTPGRQQGKPAAVFFTMPIAFKLDDPEPARDTPRIDQAKLAASLINLVNDGPERYFVFWSPTEYWSFILRSTGRVPEDFVELVERELRPYSIFWVSQFRLGSLGRLISDEEAVVQREFTLRDASGRLVPTLRRDELSPTVQQILEQLKPALGTMLGDLGKGIHFVVLRNEDAQGGSILDARAPGRFSVNFFGKEMSYRTPVGAFLPPRFCPKDHERMEGNWLYCPYHGLELR